MSFDRVGKEQLSDFAREFQKYHRPEAEMTLIREITEDDVEGKQLRCLMNYGRIV
jgi:hypothetical protein